MNKTSFIQYVESFDRICLFRHVQPDGDALGSQVGLAKWLKLNYPEKEIVMLGSDLHNFTIYEPMDQIDDLGEFLAIVLDSANQERIDDQRYQEGKALIKIDHHPVVDEYGDLQIVDSKRGSVCEIVADLLQDLGMLMNEDVANTLLSGILTDTQKFSIETTSSKTLRAAAWLMDEGANITKLNHAIFLRTRRNFEINREIQNHIEVKDFFAYVIIDQALLDQLEITESDAKMFTGSMAGVREFKIWGLFVQAEDGSFKASLRSQNNTINTIAQRYNGGGHRLACGIKGLTKETLETLITELAETSLL
ncbi:DHH family phosphoesterase [Erysipelothrix tonsillarum]|uniref:DHH family phosphoesterase n=1 Tax=Erysipelothrix tonsillarum TaxID=38402 RepID=UPI00036EB598|nr:bifunctional oligoribonuclease/PAP phosphatase NrnA [Erysipelothrix tonsillarum]